MAPLQDQDHLTAIQLNYKVTMHWLRGEGIEAATEETRLRDGECHICLARASSTATATKVMRRASSLCSQKPASS